MTNPNHTDTSCSLTSLTASTVSIRRPKKVKWTPQEDITAYELALCIPVITSTALWYPEDYIPKGCERHFEVTDQ